MKISIAFHYYNRKNLLLNTLNTIVQSSFKDIEIIIVDDASDVEHQIFDLPSIFKQFDFKIFAFKKEEKWWTCPVIPANKSIAMCTGDVIVIQNPECMHIGDVLSDINNRIKKNDYLVYATKTNDKWYQHSIHSNRCLNFCVACLKEDLLDLGGFDERYAYGIWYGDDDLILRVRRKNMNIISIDNPYVFHQWHETMQVKQNTNQICDEALYKHVLYNESGYKVKNSFLQDEVKI